jgi:ribosome-associated protein
MTPVNQSLILDDRGIEERFVRAIGPGGQNIKHEETAVELRIDTRALPPDVRKRLIELAGSSVTSAGVLVLVGRGYRSQAENRAAVRARLAGLLRRAAKAPNVRNRPRAAVREAATGDEAIPECSQAIAQSSAWRFRRRFVAHTSNSGSCGSWMFRSDLTE